MLKANEVPIAAPQRACYARALAALTDAGVEFLVGGGFALYFYLERWRATKDLDVFLRPGDLDPALAALDDAGFRTERTDPSWIAKGFRTGMLVDLIFCSYNGLLPVEASWFANGRAAELFGLPVRLVGPEEMIVSKAFVAARDRFDGSDISWMIRMLGDRLDWERVERRLEAHWQILLWQLVHYLYVFPAHRDQVPRALVEKLVARLGADLSAPPPRAPHCRGPMLDAIHYKDAHPPEERDYDGGPACDAV
jgi:hypothetical protein